MADVPWPKDYQDKNKGWNNNILEIQIEYQIISSPSIPRTKDNEDQGKGWNKNNQSLSQFHLQCEAQSLPREIFDIKGSRFQKRIVARQQIR